MNENMKFVQFKTVSLTQESVLNHCQNHLHVLEIKKIYQSSVNNVNLLVLKLANVIYIKNKHTPDKTGSGQRLEWTKVRMNEKV